MRGDEPDGHLVDDGPDGPVDPLEAILDQLSPADVGELLATAAAFHPEDPAHAAAWNDVHGVAATAGLESEIARIRGRVAQWATRGSGLTTGHMGVDVTDDLRRSARMAVADAVVDACVAFVFGDRLEPATYGVLLRPWGLPEASDEDDAAADGPDAD
jgi:hypothetical protein